MYHRILSKKERKELDNCGQYINRTITRILQKQSKLY